MSYPRRQRWRRLKEAASRAAATKGKVERFFRTVRDQFLVEIQGRDGLDLPELNRLFSAWLEVVYHRRVHSETGQTPLARFETAGAPALPTPALLREAFLWSQERTVTKTATVSLHANQYEVDPALASILGEVIVLRFIGVESGIAACGRRAMGLVWCGRRGRRR